MQLFLGDEVTIVNGDTWVTGKTRGIILDAHNKNDARERLDAEVGDLGPRVR